MTSRLFFLTAGVSQEPQRASRSKIKFQKATNKLGNDIHHAYPQLTHREHHTCQ